MEPRPSPIQAFLDYLASQVGDRGTMADLRHGCGDATAYRAWPHVAPWCRHFDTDVRERTIMLTIAAGFATHGGTDPQAGNFGETLRRLTAGDKRGQDAESALKSFEGRFRRLLACDRAEEVCQLLPGLIRAAERRGIGVNYAELWRSLTYWNEEAKVAWAAAYWPPPATAVEDDAEGGEEAEPAAAEADTP